MQDKDSEQNNIVSEESNSKPVQKREARNEDAQYCAGERTIQVLQILKEISDESHEVSQREILEAMKETGKAKTTNPGTLSKTIDEIILQLNPVKYTGENDVDYRIRYNGEAYKNKELKNHLILQKQGIYPYKGKQPPHIKNLSFVHDFNKEELDQLMEAVNSSRRLSLSQKENLMKKIQGTASRHYESPFYQKEKGKVRFYDYAIYDRLSGKLTRESYEGIKETKASLEENIRTIQEAMESLHRIEFCFNEILSDGMKRPKKYTDGDKLSVSPYYMVVYHEQYYLIAEMTGKRTVSHFRIDLMSDITISEEEITPMRNVKNLPSRDEWDPEKYMREHMNMFYGRPQTIKIRIKSGNYVTIHDWFGTHYESRPDPEKKGYDIVTVHCVPDAMVHFTMQYGTRRNGVGKREPVIEVLDEGIRKAVLAEIGNMDQAYRQKDET